MLKESLLLCLVLPQPVSPCPVSVATQCYICAYPVQGRHGCLFMHRVCTQHTGGMPARVPISRTTRPRHPALGWAVSSAPRGHCGPKSGAGAPPQPHTRHFPGRAQFPMLGAWCGPVGQTQPSSLSHWANSCGRECRSSLWASTRSLGGHSCGLVAHRLLLHSRAH